MLRRLCKAINHLVITNVVAANRLNTSGLPAPPGEKVKNTEERLVVLNRIGTPMFGLSPRCLIDQTRAALAGEIAPEPLVLHAALILQLRQEHDVNKRPDEPRN